MKDKEKGYEGFGGLAEDFHYYSNEISSALEDAYDIKDRLRAYEIKDEPKDADGSEITIGDCIDDIIACLEKLDKKQ